VSPWKYSWKGSRLCQSRWVWKRPGVAEDRAAAVLVVDDLNVGGQLVLNARPRRAVQLGDRWTAQTGR
jgi:hypothetical protein